MAWDDTQTIDDSITHTEWNNMVTVINANTSHSSNTNLHDASLIDGSNADALHTHSLGGGSGQYYPYDYIVYKIASTYYAQKGTDGSSFSNSNFSDLVNTCLASSNQCGRIYFNQGVYVMTKPIWFSGGANLIGANAAQTNWGGGKPGTEFQVDSSFVGNYVISCGCANNQTLMPIIRNITINGNDQSNAIKAAIYLHNTHHGKVQDVMIDDFRYGGGTAAICRRFPPVSGIGILMHGDSNRASYYNVIDNIKMRRVASCGIYISGLCNANTIAYGHIAGNSSNSTNVNARHAGIYFSHGGTNTFYAMDVDDFYGPVGGAVYFAGDSDVDANKFIGFRYEHCKNGVMIADGGNGRHMFIGCTAANISDAVFSDSGSTASRCLGCEAALEDTPLELVPFKATDSDKTEPKKTGGKLWASGNNSSSELMYYNGSQWVQLS